MKWVLLLVLFNDASLFSSDTIVTKLAEPTEDACNSAGRKATESQEREITVKSGVWPDGKSWKVTKKEWTHPKFDEYSCVPGEVK